MYTYICVCSVSSASSTTKQKDREKEKEAVVAHKGSSLLSLFTRRYSNTLEDKEKQKQKEKDKKKKQDAGSLLFNKPRRDIDLIEPFSSKRTTFDSSLVNKFFFLFYVMCSSLSFLALCISCIIHTFTNFYTDPYRDFPNKVDNKEEDNGDNDGDDDNDDGKDKDEEKRTKKQKEKDKEERVSGMNKRPNILSAPAHRERTQSEDSSGVGQSSSSSCNTPPLCRIRLQTLFAPHKDTNQIYQKLRSVVFACSTVCAS
ncbi:hypothetical protein RFI_05633 [Reticulomyxa filosa]|uniref:Uncharacterized protein n=1 Tax=Reticulomyxa filosa TaxID=46433 RepID=X6NYV8_RETFI|nr:hypothetical protein RFI_05633 [Reticulomyxa filosa]|eukprot:ETO31490.1 hypothetical protein RFI_05633 [Reticulomyxa filosa]